MFEERKRSIFRLESGKKNPSRSAVREYYKLFVHIRERNNNHVKFARPLVSLVQKPCLPSKRTCICHKKLSLCDIGK